MIQKRIGRLGLALGCLLTAGAHAVPSDPTMLTGREQARVRKLLEERNRLDETVWRDEVRAQQHEQPIVDLWDALRTAPDPFAVAAAFPFTTLLPPAAPAFRTADAGIRVADGGTSGTPMTHAQWETMLNDARKAGWKIVQEEFHHAEFRWNDGRPTSVFRINLHLVMPDGSRVEWRGGVKLGWATAVAGTPPVVLTIDASGLQRIERTGPPAFEPTATRLWERDRLIQPGALIAHDLDRDGNTDLILTGLNLLLRNTGGGRFTESKLVATPVTPMLCAVLADVTGDGRHDLVVAGGLPLPALHVYKALPKGGFAKPTPLTTTPLDLTKPMVITAGDMDGDGDTDLWMGQYKNPYLLGQLPDPYDDANDGFPCSLLRNDGKGRFEDVTTSSGFTAKRNRRVYGASLLDLDADGDLDLAVAADFAGIDVWMNDGKGRFTDATNTAVDDRMAFGMSLVADDFDDDGAIDLYLTGMGSTTMRRLHGMGLTRSDRPDIAMTRTRMGYGNRMYLNRGQGVFRQPAWRDQVARSGWSWGAVSADFDHDGDRDLYVANGHMTGKSAADYCTTFWCHDLYTPTRGQERVAKALHMASMESLFKGEASWNGFEKNRLFLNRRGSGFVESGWPMDAAIEDDCHQLAAADFDNDGRTDLALVYEDRSDPKRPVHSRFGLTVLMNRLTTGNHWIGIRLNPKPGTSPFGAQISVTAGGRTRTGVVVAGDSWATQNPTEKVFGLGATATVEQVEVRWPGGRTTRVANPAPDRYLTLE